MSETLLQVRDLRLRYGQSEILSGVSFDLKRGEALGLVGESGSGKTSTALAVIQLLGPQARLSGSICYLAGERPVELIDRSERELRALRGREIGMVFQDALAALNPVRSIASQLHEALRVHQKLSGSNLRAAALSALQDVGIEAPEQIALRYPHELSGGQRQRILIAIALACEPKLLICDEPTSALDVTVQKQVIALLHSLRVKRQLSLLFISHDLALTAEFCDRIAVMRTGKIVEIDRSEAIWHRPQTPYTKGLLACRPNLQTLPQRLLTVQDFEVDPNAAEANSAQQDLAARRAALSHKADFLCVQQLCASYPARGIAALWSAPKLALEATNFTLKRGECLGVVGESGSGKTTLARCLIRLHASATGRVLLGEAGDPANAADQALDLMSLAGKPLRLARKRFQMVFQDPYSSLNPARTIAATLLEPLAIHGLHGDRREARVHELLDAVSLPISALDRYPAEFSGGQRQRIAIARALAVEPELLICDESVSALDVSVQAQILNLLKNLQARFGLTLIFISHDLSVIRFLADQVLVMANGRVVEQGPADQVLAPGVHHHAVTQALLDAVPRGL